jgi:predicted nucleic acid-binding protein
MSTFVDTSAFLAVLDADESSHGRADRIWTRLLDQREGLVTTSYVLVETLALTQARLGLEATRAFHLEIIPVLRVVWVDQDVHQAAMAALLTANRKRLSLVDCASFEVMRREGLTRAFALDRHFTEQGFQLVR